MVAKRIQSVLLGFLVLLVAVQASGLLVFVPVEALSIYNLKRLLFILFISITATLFVTFRFLYSFNFKINAASVGLFLLLCCAFFSSAISVNPAKSLAFLSYCLIALLAFQGLVKGNTTFDAQYPLAVVGLAVAFYAFSFVEYMVALIVFEQPFFLDTTMYQGFVNQRFLNQVQSWLLPVVCLLPLFVQVPVPLSRSVKGFVKGLFWLLIGVYVCILFFTGGRGMLAAWTFTLVMFSLWFGRNYFPVVKCAVGVLLTGTLVYFFFNDFLPWLLSTEAPRILLARITSSGRLDIWSFAFDLWLDSPVFGSGPLAYAHYSARFSHPHNFLLWLLTECGLLFTLLLFGFICWGMWRYQQAISGAVSRLSFERLIQSYGLLTAVTVAFVHSMLSGIYLMPSSHAAGFLMLTLAYLDYRSLQEKEERYPIDMETTRHCMQWQRGGGIMCLLLLLSLGAMLHYLADTHYGFKQTGEIVSNKGRDSPGFWKDGSL
ncbi:O-antigen ligase family protein [Desulfogranum marinum]|uniref:O-antigen ligase family protein n=1 Tax=Desulfogranum marinum TaxID=453220 RepID=UPI0029C7359D|nr:O-antigen ligase family protein [Desulfogranum marinum]